MYIYIIMYPRSSFSLNINVESITAFVELQDCRLVIYKMYNHLLIFTYGPLRLASVAPLGNNGDLFDEQPYEVLTSGNLLPSNVPQIA